MTHIYYKILGMPPTVQEKLRACLHNKGYRGPKAIARLFGKDIDADKTITLAEIRQGCKDHGMCLIEQELIALYSSFNKKEKDEIDLDEFINVLRPPMSPSRRAIVHRAFGKLDKDDEGVISVDHMRKMYDVTKQQKFKSGEWTEDKAIDEFMNDFCGPEIENNVVTWENFIDYYAMVSAGAETDVLFDHVVRAAWGL